MGLFFNISFPDTVSLYCHYPIHSDIDFAMEKSHDFEPDSPVSGISRTADFLIFKVFLGSLLCEHSIFTTFKAALIT